MSGKPERVLHILPGLNYCGGIESFVMNYYRRVDRERWQFDFVYCNDADKGANYLEEVRALGGNVVKLPRLTAASVPVNYRLFDKYLREHKNEYRIVHCNIANAAFIFLDAAKKHNIPVRIMHSHQSKAAYIPSHAVRNVPLFALGRRCATHNFACSKTAGDFLFGKAPYIITNNAVDREKYSYNISLRENVRRGLGLSDDRLVIGSVGRLCAQKNPLFALKVFSEIKRLVPDAAYLWAGDGELRGKAEAFARSLSLTDSVRFLGNRTDVPALYQAMDAFLLPSLYEGLPFTGVEAQFSGLPTFFSDACTDELRFSGTLHLQSLGKSPREWAANIIAVTKNLPSRENRCVSPISEQYDIAAQAGRLCDIYKGLLHEQ